MQLFDVTKTTLEWGGDWHSIKDDPHGQWPAGDLAEYRKARAWQKEHGL